MIEFLLGWIDSLKGLLAYAVVYVVLLISLQFFSDRAYLKRLLDDDDDQPPSANYMP